MIRKLLMFLISSSEDDDGCPGYLDYPFQNKLSALALSLTSPTYYA
jgi:hypothetical protein